MLHKKKPKIPAGAKGSALGMMVKLNELQEYLEVVHISARIIWKSFVLGFIEKCLPKS